MRFFIILALIIFSLSAVYGYFSASLFPAQAEELINQFAQTYGPILKADPWAQCLLVFLNNSLTVFLTILLAIGFGVFPLLVLFTNGLILGVLAFTWQQEQPWLDFFMGLLPHGLVEIPVIIISSAIGLRIGQIALKKFFKKEGQLKLELKKAFKLFLKALLPLLALAALLEIFLNLY